jgi:hypothetical protein
MLTEKCRTGYNTCQVQCREGWHLWGKIDTDSPNGIDIQHCAFIIANSLEGVTWAPLLGKSVTYSGAPALALFGDECALPPRKTGMSSSAILGILTLGFKNSCDESPPPLLLMFIQVDESKPRACSSHSCEPK